MTNLPPTTPPPATQAPTAAPAAVPAAPGTASTSGMAIAGLILAFIPILCLNFVGLVLGIIALVKINKQPTLLKGKGLAIGAIVVSLAWLPVLAAIAIPNFLQYKARARQSEAKVNLKGIYIAEKSFIAESGKAGATFREIGWSGEPSNRYTYFLGNDVAAPAKGKREELPPTVKSFVNPADGSFKAVAVGNIDTDATLDVWVIDGENQLLNLVDDVHE